MTDHRLKIRIKTIKFVVLKDENHTIFFCYILENRLFLTQQYENTRIILMNRQNILYFLNLALEFHYAK